MSALEVVAKPEFAKADLEWLTQLRQTKAHSPGPPAFTLVFPGADSAIATVRHVEAVCAATGRIRFCLRSAMIVPEHKTGWFHIFLVPDEGFGAIIRLHDRLHVGPLACCWRPDVPYIPHLTVASTRELDHARTMMASLNAKDLGIAGRIDALDVQARDANETHCVAHVPLARHGFFH
ncbi:MAG TPA: 2'-5' RNA ligase family protein [Stellaceae bacterium]|nr:2'-5' RNA ligase family protein [Stellaceae bacterium]